MVAAPPTEALVVFALVAGAVALFVTEAVPADVTAIVVVVALVAWSRGRASTTGPHSRGSPRPRRSPSSPCTS